MHNLSDILLIVQNRLGMEIELGLVDCFLAGLVAQRGRVLWCRTGHVGRVEGIDFRGWVLGVSGGVPAAGDGGVEDGEGGGKDAEDEVNRCPGHDAGEVPWECQSVCSVVNGGGERWHTGYVRLII